MNKRILYIWDADYPWDVRVEKICKTLQKERFEVHIACRNLKALPTKESINTIHIHRLKSHKNKTLNYYISFPLFCNPLWITHISKIITQSNINCIIVRDLPLSSTAIMIAKKHKIPVIFDMAEDYPAMNRDIWKVRKFKRFNLILRNPYLTSLIERIVIKYVDHILVVVEESKMRLVKKGTKEAEITIVSNTPEIDPHVFQNAIPKFDKFTFVYTGGLQLGRGIQIVIRALPLIAQKIPECEFLIIGDGYGKPSLMKLAKKLNVDDYIHWMGFIDHDNLFEILARCHVGIIPHFVTDHTNTTIPNKLFDYMYMSLPVLSSNIIPIQRITSEENCGFVYEDRNENDLATKLYELYRNDTHLQLGENGRLAVMKKYNWNEDSKRILAVINNL